MSTFLLIIQKKNVRTKNKIMTIATSILPFLVLLNTCTAHDENMTEDEDVVYISFWIVSSLLFLFYIGIVATALPYSRPRVPLFAFILLVFLPPFFFFFLLYLLVISSLSRPVVLETVEVQQVQPQSRAIPRSRQDLRRV